MSRKVNSRKTEKPVRGDSMKREGKLSARLLEIGRDCAARLKKRSLSLDHGSLLYDECGLPKGSLSKARRIR